MSFVGRFFSRFAESDESRMTEEVRDWAAQVPGTTSIADAPLRKQARIAGVVRKIIIWPREGDEAEYLEAFISDGTGDVSAAWTGRRSIPGLSLGTKLVIEGLLYDDRGMRTITNPKFEFVT
jgi:hypothetical protein